MGQLEHLEFIVDEGRAGRRAALATVVRTDRSVPRRTGASMVIRADGSTNGSVGGGEMEARVVRAALECMRDGVPRLVNYRLIDPASGDPGVCGGEVDVYVEPYMASPTLFIIGAGHVGRAVAELATWSGWAAHVWDDRDGLTTDLPDGATGHSADLNEALASTIDERSAIVIVTRNVSVDVELLPTVLATSARYIGVMGSGRRWSTTRDLLIAKGVTEAALERISTPIGLEIGAETPEEIAISILAEVVREQQR